MGKSTINSNFSIAMLVHQRVHSHAAPNATFLGLGLSQVGPRAAGPAPNPQGVPQPRARAEWLERRLTQTWPQ